MCTVRILIRSDLALRRRTVDGYTLPYLIMSRLPDLNSKIHQTVVGVHEATNCCNSRHFTARYQRTQTVPFRLAALWPLRPHFALLELAAVLHGYHSNAQFSLHPFVPQASPPEMDVTWTFVPPVE